MKLLLDTHVFYWANLTPKKLNSRAARALRDARSELWLYPVSIIELADLERKSRIRVDLPFDDWRTGLMSGLGCREAPFTNEIAFETRGLSLPHTDPADRILAATARALDLTLLTADEKLLGARRVPTMRAD